MKFITPATKEGYIAYVFGISDVENPYLPIEGEWTDWNAGWYQAKLLGATMHPDEVGNDDNSFEPTRTEVANKELNYIQTAEYFILTEYFEWLDQVDPRVREVALMMDSDPPMGCIGVREEFAGQIEGLLLAQSKDGRDFIKLYTQLKAGSKGENMEKHKKEGARIWNMVAMSIKNYFDKISGSFRG